MIRYRPAASLTWLTDSAEAGLKKAERLSKQAVRTKSQFGGSSPKERLYSAGKALFEVAKSAYTEVAKSKMDAHEYVLNESSIIVVSGSKSEEIKYADISGLEIEGLKAKFKHKLGLLTIQPYAFVVAGVAKAPIGWNRDGHEVPYELLIEEIAARSGLEMN